MGGELYKIQLYKKIGTQDFEDIVSTLEKVTQAIEAQTIEAYLQDYHMQGIDFLFPGIKIPISELDEEKLKKRDGIRFELQKDGQAITITYNHRDNKSIHIYGRGLEDELKQTLEQELSAKTLKEKLSTKMIKN